MLGPRHGQLQAAEVFVFAGDTDFEAGSGGWRDASVGQLQWVTMRASEALSPGTDHTTSTSAGEITPTPSVGAHPCCPHPAPPPMAVSVNEVPPLLPLQ